MANQLLRIGKLIYQKREVGMNGNPKENSGKEM